MKQNDKSTARFWMAFCVNDLLAVRSKNVSYDMRRRSKNSVDANEEVGADASNSIGFIERANRNNRFLALDDNAVHCDEFAFGRIAF